MIQKIVCSPTIAFLCELLIPKAGTLWSAWKFCRGDGVPEDRAALVEATRSVFLQCLKLKLRPVYEYAAKNASYPMRPALRCSRCPSRAGATTMQSGTEDQTKGINVWPRFNNEDVYIDYPFEEGMFRWDHAGRKIYRKLYGKAETRSVSHDNRLYNEALLYGEETTRDTYVAGKRSSPRKRNT